MIRHLFVPGLLGPVPAVAGAGRPAAPQLERLLARADRLVEPVGHAPGLCALFGVAASPEADLPTAAIGWLADTGEAPDAGVLHADPLQLLPDRDRLLAFDLDDDPLTGDELEALADTFNQHYHDDDLSLRISPRGRVYLHCERMPSIRTHPLSTVIGRALAPYLPDGADRRRWRGLLNETQMLCHGLAFNRDREARGRPTLGGLWFSGGGRLPPCGRGPVARVVGDGPLAHGLLALCGAAGDDEVVVEPAFERAVSRADPGAWLQALAGLEGRVGELSRGCSELQVHPGNGTVYRWRAGAAWRLWRRRRPISAYLEAGGETGGPHRVNRV